MKIPAKITLALFVAFIFINRSLWSQTVDWAKVLGGSSNIVTGVSVTTDAIGNSYTTGYFYDSPVFGSFNLSSSGGSDAFISKSDPSGNILWVKKLGGPSFDNGFAITVDPTGDIYATGNFQGSVTIDSYGLNSSVGQNVYMCKLNSLGNVIWLKQYKAPDYANIFSICNDASGNIYGTGTFSGTVVFDTYTTTAVGNADGCVFKLDANGNVVWFKSFGGSGLDVGGSITSDVLGNVYVNGRFEGIASIGSFSLNSMGASDAVVTKLNTNGTFLWVKQFGGSGVDMGGCISVNSAGELFTAGIFQSPAYFGSFNLLSGNSYVNKLDTSGNVIWVNKFEGFMPTSDVVIYSITSDASGNVYSTGTFNGGVSFGSNTNTTAILSSEPFSDDGFISKLDASGNFEWVKQLYGTGNDAGYSITHNSGKLYTTGKYEAPVAIDSFTLTNNGAFLIKISSGTVGIEEDNFNNENNNLRAVVYPNPSNGKIAISIDYKIKDVELTLIDFTGSELQAINNFNTETETIDISFLPSGIYFLRVKGENNKSSKIKIIKL
jgi:hypothetical protein